MTNVSPWIIRTLTFPQFASLYDTVHCPFSPWELVQTSPVHPNPMIWYVLSHINLLISSSKQPPYLPIMHFHSHSEICCHVNFHCSVYHHDIHYYCHIALHDHVVDIVFVAKPPCIIFHTCHSWFIAPSRYTAGGMHIESYYVLVSSCNHWVVNK